MNVRQALLINANTVARSNEALGDRIASSNKELGEKLESISKAEIKSLDRVNISLEEYERLKRENSEYFVENLNLRSILEKIEAPIDKPIVPGSIRTYTCSDFRKWGRTIYHIEFEIDEVI